ncbi:GntR family transcriptional regulator [Acutalibacter sp.]|uniref:GntR family transcriptional regulator n=1 Tax=Acutalibacter sp. TaxID=1918636 RepID=UPI00216BCC14|nr:GntR family transcriptional regulator [Acutalibacter sp.]
MSTNAKIPLYQKIYNEIKSQILSGQYPPGERIPTELEISEAYSVSRITATRAVKDLETDGYIHRIRKRGSIVNPPQQYRENQSANSSIAIILPFDMDVSLEICDGAQSNALLYNHTISLFNSTHSKAQERKIIEDLLKIDVQGFVVWPTGMYENLDVFSKIQIQHKPLVFLDFPKVGIHAPCVSADNQKAMRQVTNYAISKGHRRIAFCGTSIKEKWTEGERFKGYIQALIEHQLIPQEELFVEILAPAPSGGEAVEENSTRQALQRLMALPEPPTAIVCINDTCATHIEREALALNIPIPQTLSIIGVDNRSICQLMPVPITSVKQNFRAIGEKAVEIIEQLRRGVPCEDKYTFDVEIVERSSVLDLSAAANQKPEKSAGF